MTPDKFRAMCAQHDLTYAYSDDHSVWRRGHDSLAAVRAAAETLPWPEARRLWNETVDTKIMSDAREQFYWPARVGEYEGKE